MSTGWSRRSARRRGAGRGGRIITMSSGIADRSGAGRGDYALSKAAIEGYTKGAARDLGQEDHRQRAGRRAGSHRHEPGCGDFADYLRSLTALARYGTADEIANVVVFLPHRASYITGAVIPVDGARGLESRARGRCLKVESGAGPASA